MSFPRYPEYKDSGVEWLGAVPVHWNLVPLKQVISRIESGTSVNAIDTPAGDGELGVLKTSCVYHGHFDAEENKAVLPDEYDRVSCPVMAGTLIVSRMNTPDLVGAAGVVHASHENLFLPDRLWQVHFDGAHPDFVHHWTHTPAYRAQVEMACAGTSSSMQNLGQDQFRCFVIPLPVLSEQTAIATFLDRETAKIDALVAEQEKLITLLQEKRQAVISHAVTKGLDPNAPMKDSGVEWLGEVPAHWEALTLRRCAVAVQTGGTPSAEALIESLDEGFVWYTPGDFGSSLKLSTSTRRITNEAVASGEAKLFPPRSVLIVSIGATLGKVGFAHDASSANQQINAVIPDAGVDGYFLAWSLSVKAEAMRFLSNASTIGIMNQEKTKEIWIALPPRDEQAAIATFLDQETTKLDTLVNEARTAITLLQERRTALISAAVTGQIDVRGWAPAFY